MITPNLTAVLSEIRKRDEVGAFVEFGVFKGTFTQQLLPIVSAFDTKYWGVDSFEGMNDPSEDDRLPDGTYPYPKGRLKAENYDKILTKYFEENGYIYNQHFKFIKGFVPNVLDKFETGDIEFAYIDLDQYMPTVHAFNYVAPRIKKNGFILFDDYFQGRDYLAAKAVTEILEQNESNFEIVGEGVFFRGNAPSNQICVKVLS